MIMMPLMGKNGKQVLSTIMKINRLIQFSVLCGAILFLVCRIYEINSFRRTQEIMIDGSVNEWEAIPKSFFTAEKIAMALQNDEQNLFLSLRFQEQGEFERVQGSGLIIYISIEGEFNDELGYQFRSDLPRGEMPHNFSETAPPKGYSRPSGPVSGRFNVIRLINNREDISYSLLDENRPMGAFSSDKGVGSFEFKIPLINAEGKPYGKIKDFKGKVGLCLEINPPEWGLRQDKAMEPEGRMGGGMGGPGGGKPGGPGGIGSPPRMPPEGAGTMREFKEIKLKLTVNLAVHP
jgi:hypothetical protein